MKALLKAIFIFAIGFAVADEDVATAFKNAELTPDVVRVAPRNSAEITYGNKTVDLGNILLPTEVLFAPEINYDYESDALYTLVMIDPDTLGDDLQILHWLIVNIVGADISTGNVLALYLPPTPIVKLEDHRYTFLVYKQNEEMNTTLLTALETALNLVSFSVDDFASENNLGDPVAGNFFKSQYLELVETVLDDVLDLIG